MKMKKVFSVTYDKWFMDRNGDWDYRTYTEFCQSEQKCDELIAWLKKQKRIWLKG
jgi:hypothetical protein